MGIPSQIPCNCYSKVFNAFNVSMSVPSKVYETWILLIRFLVSCIIFDRLKSHTPLPCPGTQSINIALKFRCVFFILNITIANTVISKRSYFRLNIWWDVINVQKEQGTEDGAIGDIRQNRSPDLISVLTWNTKNCNIQYVGQTCRAKTIWRTLS